MTGNRLTIKKNLSYETERIKKKLKEYCKICSLRDHNAIKGKRGTNERRIFLFYFIHEVAIDL